MKLARLRSPESATPDEVELASMALQRTVDVMLGHVHPQQAHAVLIAANRLRDGICGKEADRHVVEGSDGGPVRVEFVFNHEEKKP